MKEQDCVYLGLPVMKWNGGEPPNGYAEYYLPIVGTGFGHREGRLLVEFSSEGQGKVWVRLGQTQWPVLHIRTKKQFVDLFQLLSGRKVTEVLSELTKGN